MKLYALTGWTLASLTAVSLLIGGLGRSFLLYKVEQAYTKMQANANSQQAARVAGILEEQLEAGVPPKEVEHRLQDSLINASHDEAGFLCLLGDQGRVLCHPDPKAVGMNMQDALLFDLEGARPLTFGERMARHMDGSGLLRNQSYAGETHIVYQRPVKGTNWMVSVHANLGLIQERVRQLWWSILQVAIPTSLCFILFGTFAVRLVGRQYERRIEAANADLEKRVSQRTADLEKTTMQYRSLFDGAASAIFVRRSDGTILDVNHRAEALTGFSRDTLLTTSFGNLCQKAAELPTQSFHADSASNGRQPWDGVLVTNTPSRREVQVYESTIHGQDEMLILDLVQDMTDHKLLEAQLRQSQKMEGIGQLAGGIAHDFNNLLTAVLGYAELARASVPKDSTIYRQLSEVLAAGDRAADLTRQLLMFSRKQMIEPRIVDLNDILRNIDKMLSRIIGEPIEIVADYPSNLWPVYVDPGQIEQVILNLAVNARDAMPEGGTLKVSTSNLRRGSTDSLNGGQPNDEERVLLAVTDSGCGIPEEIRDHIFEPFFTTKEQGKGTGLGLATVYGIVKQHGGDIEVESEMNQGTTFRITLPRASTDATLSVQEEGSKTLPHGSETLLVVEDEPGVRNLIQFTLDELGYQVLPAANADEALTIAEAFSSEIQMMLTDVVMPGTSVRDLVSRIGVTRPDMKVAYMTGYTDDLIVHQGVLDKRVMLLRKPFTAVSLAETVRHVLDT